MGWLGVISNALGILGYFTGSAEYYKTANRGSDMLRKIHLEIPSETALIGCSMYKKLLTELFALDFYHFGSKKYFNTFSYI